MEAVTRSLDELKAAVEMPLPLPRTRPGARTRAPSS
jgi:hypothetical protein